MYRCKTLFSNLNICRSITKFATLQEKVAARCFSGYKQTTFTIQEDFSSAKNDSKNSQKFHWGIITGSAVLGGAAYSLWKRDCLPHLPSVKVFAAESEPAKESIVTPPTVNGDKDSNSDIKKDGEKPGDDTAPAEAETSNEETEAPKPEYPSRVNYLIIGGGTAAYHACTAIRVKDTRGKVLIVTDEDFGPYSRPPLSKNLWYTKDREKARNLAYEDGDDYVPIFYQRPGIYMPPSELDDCENGAVALANNRKVVKLDVWRRKAFLDNGTVIEYDKCLIATGGSPKNLPVIEQADEEVHKRTLLFRGVTDYWKLDAIAANARSVAVIGGGFLGSELACALANQGKESNLKVYQTFPEGGNLGKVLPENLSKWATQEMKEMGINVKSSDEVTSATFEDGQCVLSLKSGEKIITDYLVVAVGIKANTELAQSSGLEVDPEHGGFRVNSEMQARSDVFVAGDASCFYDQILGRRRVEHYEHAEITGHIAGENMTGGNMPYWIQTSFWSDLYPFLTLEAVGLVDSSLETYTVLTGEETPVENPENNETTEEGEKAESTLKEDFLRGGIVFYKKDDRIVGVLTWNLPGKSRVPLARRLLRDGGIGKDPLEIAQLFDPLAQNTFKKKERPKQESAKNEHKPAATTTQSKDQKQGSNKDTKSDIKETVTKDQPS